MLGEFRPDDGAGDVAPDREAAAPVGSPDFSIAFAAATLVPASGTALSTSFFTADGSAAGFVAPMVKTLVPPVFSTLGVLSPPMLKTFAPIGFSTFGTPSPPIDKTLAFGAEAAGADSPACGRFAIFTGACCCCCPAAAGCWAL